MTFGDRWEKKLERAFVEKRELVRVLPGVYVFRKKFRLV
jgi:hypothetical protein